MPESGNQYSRNRPHPYLNARPPQLSRSRLINSNPYESYLPSQPPLPPYQLYSSYPSHPSDPWNQQPQNFYSNISLSADTGPTRIGAIQDVQNVTVDYMDVNMNVGNIKDQAELGLLRSQSSLDAVVNSSARFDPPRCKFSTRRAIMQRIEDWADDANTAADIFWLKGGAGVGKSAVAQTLAEKYQRNQQLAASFFFFRAAPSRSDGNTLIPTLTFQLIQTFPDLKVYVEDKIRSTCHTLFSRDRQSQMVDLLLEPFHRIALQDNTIEDVSCSRPWLIVIDGLDECSDPEVQCDLLRIIAGAAFHLPYPLRFFITSRPESHITQTFDHDPDLQAIKVHRYNLSDDSDADHDIREFLLGEFQEIRRVHRLRHYLPPHWPGESVVDTLVERSSAHFIYASTVVGYIKSPRHRPDDRLQVVLGLRPRPGNDQPYAQLDALFGLIFCGLEEDHRENVCTILGILYLRSENVDLGVPSASNIQTVFSLLPMRPGDLELFFDPLASLVVIDRDIRILHKSLFDYLIDPTRSGPFVDLSLSHRAIVANMAAQFQTQNRFCREIFQTENIISREIFHKFAYHCGHACSNNDLKNFFASSYWLKILHNWMKSCPELGSLATTMFYILRMLQNQDLEDIHRSTIKKIVESSHSVWFLNPTDNKQFPNKEELEFKFRNWVPKCFNLAPERKAQCIIQQYNFIEQEHNLWSSVLTSIWPAGYFNSLTIDGKFFIHKCYHAITSFNFTEETLLFLSYAKYSKACSLSHFSTYGGKSLEQANAHLQNFENGLISSPHALLHQKPSNNTCFIPAFES